MNVFIWEHKFVDGSLVRLVMKDFKEAKKAVPHFQFCFLNGGKPTTLEVPMYDRHQDKEILTSLHEAICEYLEIPVEVVEEQTITLVEDIEPFKGQKFSEKDCKDCGRAFIPDSPAQKACNFCRMSPEEAAELQAQLDAEEIENE
jgi:hypothetical protein